MKVSIFRKSGHEIVNLNRRRASRERCLNCSGWIHKEVAHCEFTECPLYPYRSGTGKQNPKYRKKAIRAYCLWCTNGQRTEVRLCPSQDCPLLPYRMGNIDRSTEIKSLPKNGHIEALSKPKIKNQYLSIGVANQKQEKTSLVGAVTREKMSLLPPA